MPTNTQEFRRKRVRQLREKIAVIRASKGCKYCPEKEPCCLSFHHRNPKDNLGEVNAMAKEGYSWTRIQAEIEKCDVVCENCHRKIHAGILEET